MVAVMCYNPSSFSHMTQEFVNKLSLSSEISFKTAARTDICSFKVAVLFFTRALLKQKG